MSSQPLPLREIIRKFRELGFEGPIRKRNSKAPHGFMKKGTLKVTIPNEHRGDVSGQLVERIRKMAGVTKEDWDSA